MPKITGSQRALNYPLNRTVDMLSETSEGVVDNTTPSGFPNDSDEKIDIILNISLNEYNAIANSIDVGRDIAYGDNSLEIWWIWVRSLQTMSICDAVTACILTNIDTQNAIQAISGGDPNINGNPLKWQQLAIEPVASCDDDITWGYVKALWNFVNQQNKDFLQILEEATNTAQQLSGMMSAIPLFGLLPFDEIVGWLGDLGEYNLSAYNASITTQINEEIWCDLFCIAKQNNCSITFEQLWDYMLEKFGGLNFPTLGATFAELVAFMVTGTYANDRIVYLWTLVQLGIAFIGGRFLNINAMNEIAIHAQTGDPDNDWELLCDDCPSMLCFDMTDLAEFDIDNGAQDAIFGNPLPSFEAEKFDSDKKVWAWFSYDFDSPVTVENVNYDHYNSVEPAGSPDGTCQKQIKLYDDLSVLLATYSVIDTTGYLAWDNFSSGAINVSDVKTVEVFCALSSGSVIPGSIWVDNLCIEYLP